MSKSKVDSPSHVSKLPTKDAEYIKGVPVDDSALADDYMLVYDAATETLGYESGPAPAAHTIASHSDTTATGAELETLTDGSNADALHVHAGGSGDVVGPAGATDNAIARYDTATGKLLQNSAVFIDNDGKVGIGTATPDHLLHVLSAAATNAVALIAAPDGYDASLQLFEGADYGFEFQYDGSADTLFLWSRKFFANEAIRMTWTKTGYVGIGTQAPATELDVDGDITVSGDIQGATLTNATHDHADAAGGGTLSLGEAHIDLVSVHTEVRF